MDAVLAYDKNGFPTEQEWPEADFIIGNPPFLGCRRLRAELSDAYVKDLFKVYAGRVSHAADYVCYWFERTRQQIHENKTKRAGLLATQSLRAGANREVLEKIKTTGDIFMARSDRPWVLDGASVRISMVGSDNGKDEERTLDGTRVANINADLSANVNLTKAKALSENANIAFQGPVKVGSFEISDEIAKSMLKDQNPHGRSNCEVIKPWMNASDVTQRPRKKWIIDFGEMTLEQSALFVSPFEHVKRWVKAARESNNDRQRRTYWWRLGRSGNDLKVAKKEKSRIVVTPRVAKHRLFSWTSADLVPDSRLFAFARDDDYFFGVLHSHVHEVWTLHTCSWHGVGNDPTYNTSTCFETFPFPWAPGHEPANDQHVKSIAAASRDLVMKRDTQLNPREASEAERKKLTLTALYNTRPTWLEQAHQKLDEAVLVAYGWPKGLPDDQILERLLELNTKRFAKQEATKKPAASDFAPPKKAVASAAAPRRKRGNEA
jgi:type II restriction/modification system DNA methylase subunit YeeA